MPADAEPAPPAPAPGPLERVFGVHLTHLRAAGAPAADTTPHPPLPFETHELESGRTAALRQALEEGHQQALAQLYGASEREVSEWTAGVRGPTEVFVADGLAAGYIRDFIDQGPGAAHRYQLVEDRAARVQIAAVFIHDLPVLTPGLREFLHQSKRSVKNRTATGLPAPVPGWGAIPDVTGRPSCELCALLRSVLLDQGTSAAELKWREREWYGRVATARARAFLERIHRPGPTTAEILINASVIAELSTVEARTGQLALLADLAETTSLTIRYLPARNPLLSSHVLLDLDDVLIADPGTDYVGYLTGDLGDFDRSNQARPAAETLALLRRAATTPTTDSWSW